MRKVLGLGIILVALLAMVAAPASAAPVFSATINITANPGLTIAPGATTVLTANWSTNDKDVTRCEWSVNGVKQGVISFEGTSSGSRTYSFSSSTPGTYRISFRIWHHRQTGRNASNYVDVIVTGLSTNNFAGWLPPISLEREFNSGSTLPVKFLVTDSGGNPVTGGLTATVQIGGSDPVAAVLDDASTGQWKAEIKLVGEGEQQVTISGLAGFTPIYITVK